MIHLRHTNIAFLLILPSILSIIGTSFVLLTYYRFPRLRKYRHVELAVYVAVNDLWGAIELVLGHMQSNSPACWFQGMGTSYNFLSSVLWNSVITYQIYIIVHQGAIIENMKWFHVFCWGFPLLPVLLPLITNDYGANANTWCFLIDRPHSPPDSMFVWEIMSFFVWLWLSMIFNTIVFGMIIYRLKEMQCAESLSAYKPLYRLAFCPFILVLCWILPSFLILYDAITDENYSGPGAITLDSLSTCLPPLQGFLMSVAFFMVNESARMEWKQYFCGVKPRSHLNSNTSSATRRIIDRTMSGIMGTGSSRGTGHDSYVESRGTSLFSAGTQSSHRSSTHGSEDHWVSASSKPSRDTTVSDDSVVNRQIDMLNDNSNF
jgi:hypothetical protein